MTGQGDVAGRLVETAARYHPDDAINAGIAAEALQAEAFDLSIGYPPRAWNCPDCGSTHSRGHFGAIGIHRCLHCGYVGAGGVMHGSALGGAHEHRDLAVRVAR